VQNPTEEPEVRFAVLGDRKDGVDRLSLIGTLDRDTVALLESEVDGVARGGGAVVLDLLHLERVESDAVRAVEAMARRAIEDGWMLSLVRFPDPVRAAFESDGIWGLLGADVSDALSVGDGEPEPLTLPPSPGQGEGDAGRYVEWRP
jgi:ABC-type transporter Mla MlaB component